jgi:hypothetical protein
VSVARIATAATVIAILTVIAYALLLPIAVTL